MFWYGPPRLDKPETWPITHILDGKPKQGWCFNNGEALPIYLYDDNIKYVGMEVYPNQPPRYGKLYHPWMNLPCYETLGR